MNDNFEDLKKLKVFDEFIMALGKDKIVFKDLNNPTEHHTMQFRNDGTLDIHKKKEGVIPEYESLAKINLEGIVKEIQKNPNFEQNFLSELLGMLKEVDFTEDEFSNYLVANIMTTDEVQKFVEKKGRKYNIPVESIKKLNNNDIFTWKDAKNKIKSNASVFVNGEQIGSIFKINGKFYLFNLKFIENTLLAELLNRNTIYDGTSIEHSA